jgi:hypothetical protein
MATAEDVYDRFITELRAADGEIEFDLKFLASKYKMEESQVVKGFAQFVYEASLEDNPGLPGEAEGDDADSYLKDVEGRAQGSMRDTQQRYGSKINQFMGLVGQVQRLQAGKEREMEELAEGAIREMYGSILDGVNLDIKFPEEEEMKGEMEDVEMEAPPEQEEITDEETIKEIHKRKITNNITQGEAKNTKLILNMPFIADGLREILGEEDGTKMIGLLTDITNIASFFDWAIPIDRQKSMWASKDGFAGTVSVDWEEDEVEEDETKTAEDIIAGLEAGDDILDMSDEAEELFNEVTPTIKARGLDFAMLIHETVKGIYQLIASIGIPEDEARAQLVIANTDTLAGELEDLRYGPYIAEDLNRFITSFSEHGEIDNLKEHFYGKLIALPAGEFLELVRLILMEDESAKGKAQELIDEVTQEIRDWEADGISSYGDDDDNDFEVDDYGQPSPSPVQDEDDSYAAMSDSEIRGLIDSALDNGDMDEVKRLAKYLKESLRIKFMNKLNESKFSHIGSFKSFKKKEVISLNENLSSGKQYFVRLKAEEAGFDANALTDEEKRRLEQDREWVAIRQLLEQGKRAGDAVAFVKFRLKQGASMDELSNLIATLKGDQVNLNELPMSISQYADLESSGEETPGYEKLMDDLATQKSTNIGKWVIKKLSKSANTRDYAGNPTGAAPFNQKEAYKNASPELQKRIIELGAQLVKADVAGTVVSTFGKRMSNWGSIEEIADQLESRIKGFASNLNSSLAKVEKLGAAASTVWTGDNRALFIFRSDHALAALCSMAEWCINPGDSINGGSSFYSYASGGNVQYVYFNFNLSPSDANYLTGVTVKSDGTIRAAHDKVNDSMLSTGHRAGRGNGGNPIAGTFSAFLDFFEIGEPDKSEILQALSRESSVMSEIGPIYQQLSRGGRAQLDRQILEIINRTEKRANASSFTEETFALTQHERMRDDLVIGILRTMGEDEVNNIKDTLFERFKEKGCTNVEAAKYFKNVFGENIPAGKIDSILSANRKKTGALREIIGKMKRGKGADRERIMRRVGNAATLEETLRRSEIMLKNIDISSTYLESLK